MDVNIKILYASHIKKKLKKININSQKKPKVYT